MDLATHTPKDNPSKDDSQRSRAKVCRICISLSEEDARLLRSIQEARGYLDLASVAKRGVETYLARYRPKTKKPDKSPRLAELEAQFRGLHRPTPAFLKPLQAAERKEKDKAYKSRMGKAWVHVGFGRYEGRRGAGK